MKEMVSDLKTFAHQGCTIAAQIIIITIIFCLYFFCVKFCLTSRIFLVSVLLSASVERCFVSRMRDFFIL